MHAHMQTHKCTHTDQALDVVKRTDQLYCAGIAHRTLYKQQPNPSPNTNTKLVNGAECAKHHGDQHLANLDCVITFLCLRHS